VFSTKESVSCPRAGAGSRGELTRNISNARNNGLETGERPMKAARPTGAPSSAQHEQKASWRQQSTVAVWSEATIKRPGSGVDRVFKSVQKWDDRSGRLRRCWLGYALRLRAFLSLNDFEFNIIALLEALVSLRLDGTIVDEHIRAVIPADKAEALCVIEPFHFAFNSRHVPYSGLSLGAR
jgi:hypothetical protein